MISELGRQQLRVRQKGFQHGSSGAKSMGSGVSGKLANLFAEDFFFLLGLSRHGVHLPSYF